ncbi:MAG: glycine cleavage system aminomethyltransferase GcvT, partial [Clostridiales bacterium]|nr:glycine cleavage system aminomethyltransferase GcvT [Clostridiales bacterium]
MKKTALFDQHVALGGKIIDFGGWALPVQFSGIIEEHLAVRQRAGLFDVSHMGEILVEGPDAQGFVEYLVTADV